MAWKTNWHYMTGNVEITVRAKDENERFQKFTFPCYVSKEVDSYDRLENLSDIAHHMALLRNYYHAEITDIKEIQQ